MLRAALVALIEKHQLDALVLPFRTAVIDTIPAEGGGGRAETRNSLSSYTGLPTLIVPGGFFPGDGMPFGLQFLGKPWSEPTLLTVGAGYESTTRHRRPPVSTPALPGESFTY
ncbi:MAG: hypothetical protein JNJ82_08250 [Opitutaceae bacterium]|nr:hypothetical protein [Opitutaceae bacterium]